MPCPQRGFLNGGKRWEFTDWSALHGKGESGLLYKLGHKQRFVDIKLTIESIVSTSY